MQIFNERIKTDIHYVPFNFIPNKLIDELNQLKNDLSCLQLICVRKNLQL